MASAPLIKKGVFDVNMVLFAHPHMAKLAEEVAQANPLIKLGKISWNKFPDGSPDMFIFNYEELVETHVVFLACAQAFEDYFAQYAAIVDLARFYGVEKVTVIVPYFATGTMDRAETGEIATAYSLAFLLSSIPPSEGSLPQILTYDIHSLQQHRFFGNMVSPRFRSGIPLLLSQLNGQAVTIAFPDEGAMKRFRTKFKEYPSIVCSKKRVGAERIVTIEEGDPQGVHVLIVDDLVMSGGTLLETATVLRNAGALTVSAYCTHSVFAGKSWEHFPFERFDVFYTTDSCPLVVELIKGHPNITVLPLAADIAEFLTRK